jgi:hypothetical protein
VTIADKVKKLIKDFNGIKEPEFKRVSFPIGIRACDGEPFAIILYLDTLPTHALLDALRDDLEYLSEPH